MCECYDGKRLLKIAGRKFGELSFVCISELIRGPKPVFLLT
jgi:hypothetical protein